MKCKFLVIYIYFFPPSFVIWHCAWLEICVHVTISTFFTLRKRFYNIFFHTSPLSQCLYTCRQLQTGLFGKEQRTPRRGRRSSAPSAVYPPQPLPDHQSHHPSLWRGRHGTFTLFIYREVHIAVYLCTFYLEMAVVAPFVALMFVLCTKPC